MEPDVRLPAAASRPHREMCPVRPQITDPPHLRGGRVRNPRLCGEVRITGALGGHELRAKRQPMRLDLEDRRGRSPGGGIDPVPDAGENPARDQTPQRLQINPAGCGLGGGDQAPLLGSQLPHHLRRFRILHATKTTLYVLFGPFTKILKPQQWDSCLTGCTHIDTFSLRRHVRYLNAEFIYLYY